VTPPGSSLFPLMAARFRSGPLQASHLTDHFLHNPKASVATPRLVFGTGPESCSA
jgi:hypothetical protein